MITFRKVPFWERVKMFFSPSYRAKSAAQTKEAILYLLKNPDAPCMINGEIIPHGRGSQQSISEQLLGFKSA